MELRDAFLVERYRAAAARQDAMARGARGAISVYLFACILVALAAATIEVAREPFGLDRRTMPDVFALLGWLVVLAGMIAALQVVICTIRESSARHARRELDPDGPPARGTWWIGNVGYLIIIGASVIVVWNAFASMGEGALRGM
jgi:hypothetical protein